MRSATQFALRRPKAAIIAWLVLVAALALVGRGLEGKLHATDLRVSGSSSAQARALVAEQFGESATIPVLLSGPSHHVRSQGRALVARLQRERGVSVLSPWNSGPGRTALRPSADRVLMLVSISGTTARVSSEARHVRELAHDVAHPPVRAQVTGVPLAAQDVADASWHAIHRADLIALPVLLLVLLLVFRTPLAAALPVAFGASTVWAANGVLALVAGPLNLDALAIGIASMVGLALAVDYSLLMVTRVRELRREGLDHRDAVVRAAALTRHTVLAAGAAILLAMVIVAAMSPTQAMLSVAVGVCSVAVLAVLGATVALPAALLLTGGRIGLATRTPRRSLLSPLTAAVTRRPALAGGLATLALLALALPALSLRTGAPDARELPASNSARQDFEAIRSVSGPGWGAGFEVVSVADRGAMTTPKRLAALARLEARLRRDPAVREVFGPGSIAKNAAALRRAGRALANERRKLQSAAPRQARGLNRLAGSVSSASTGVGSLEGALGQAKSAAGKLDESSSAASSGLVSLQSGVDDASAGARQLRARLATAGNGGQALGRGAGAARDGAQGVADAIDAVAASARRLHGSLGDLQGRLQSRAAALDGTADAAASQRADLYNQLNSAQVMLQSGRQTVQTLAALVAIKKAKTSLDATNVAGAIRTTSGQLGGDAQSVSAIASSLPVAKARTLARQAQTVATGIATLRDRLAQYGADVTKIAGGSAALADAIRHLDGGSHALSSGIAALRRGVGELSSGVDAGRERSAALAAGLKQASGAVDGLRGSAAPTASGAPRSVSADVVDSGYFVLAALDNQRAAAAGLNVAHGGEAARILVVPRSDANSKQTRALYDRMRNEAAAFGPQTGTHTVVGGPAAMLIDYQLAMDGRLLGIVIALALATTLLLMVVLRAVLVPIVGVLLNAACAAATLGVIERLFGGAHPLLGGPGHVDPTALAAVFAVMFALSIDYQLFIVGRIHQELASGRSVQDAIATGMQRTAGVVTGAALSMLAVFAPFASANVTSLRVFGIGLAVAIALDATIVRLVLLPAVLRLLGRRAWWPMVHAPAIRRPASRLREVRGEA